MCRGRDDGDGGALDESAQPRGAPLMGDTGTPRAPVGRTNAEPLGDARPRQHQPRRPDRRSPRTAVRSSEATARSHSPRAYRQRLGTAGCGQTVTATESCRVMPSSCMTPNCEWVPHTYWMPTLHPPAHPERPRPAELRTPCCLRQGWWYPVVCWSVRGEGASARGCGRGWGWPCGSHGISGLLSGRGSRGAWVVAWQVAQFGRGLASGGQRMHGPALPGVSLSDGGRLRNHRSRRFGHF
jgi:hypothetical protein